MADAQTITYAFVGNASGLVSAAGAASNALGVVEGAAGKTLGALGSIVAGAAKATAALAAIGAGAAVAGMTAAVKIAASFEQQMSAVTAVMNQTELAAAGGSKALNDLALTLGKETSFSAREAAAGLEVLAKAGISVKDIMGGGARAALDLAAAGGVSVAEAAEVASAAMNNFGKTGADMAHIANVVAGAANVSAIDVGDFRLSLTMAGAAANLAGVSFEDTATAIALMGQAGIKGSDAGTSLKTMFLNLQPSTKKQTELFRDLGIVTADGANQFFTAEGKAKGLADIAGVLQDATAGMTDQQKMATLEIMFGTDALRAAAILTKAGAAGFRGLATEMEATGTAQEIANRRLDNLAGSLEKLKGSVETVAISIGLKFTPILKRMVDGLTDVVNRVEPAITAFAERAAAGLDKMIERAQAAGPRFLAFGTTLLALGRYLGDVARDGDTMNDWLTHLPSDFVRAAATAGGFVVTLRNIGAAVKEFAAGLSLGSVTGGASTLIGGLIGAFQQIEPVVMSVGRAIIGNITDTFTFLTTRVLPPVVFAVQQIGTVLERTLLPAAAATGMVLRGILGDTLDWLARTVLPPLLSIIEQTANFWTQVILPTLPAIAQALRTTLGETVQWLATDVWPKLRVAAELAWGFISGFIVPGLPVLARLLRDLLGGALEWIGTTGWPMLVTGATLAWRFLNEQVIPVVRDTYDWLKVKLPEAITTVVATFETIKGKVEPIIMAALNGDIAGAIQKLGSAFGEFATLVTGWLGEQVAEIKWDEAWSKITDAATALATYLSKQAVDFAGWLGGQIAKIRWARLWQRTVEAATALATYLSKQAVDFGTWLGDQIAKIQWANLWQRIVAATSALATYLSKQAVDFATWLGKEVEKIPWAKVWSQIKLTASMIADAIITAAIGLDNALTTWLNAQIVAIKWAELGTAFGQRLTGSAQAGADAAGADVTRLDTAALAAGLSAFFTAALEAAGLPTTVSALLTALTDLFLAWDKRMLDEWNAHRQTDWDNFKAWDQKMLAEWNAFWQAQWDAFVAWAKKLLDAFNAWLKALLDAVVKWGADLLAGIQGWFQSIVDAIAQWAGETLLQISQFFEAVKEVWDAGWNGLWQRAGEALDAVWGLINQKGADILGAFTNWIPQWAQAGLDMANAMINAVGTALDGLMDRVTGPIKAAIDAVKAMLPGGGQAAPDAAPAPEAMAAPDGGAPVSNASTQAQRIARAKQLATEHGLKDPDLFAAQLMQESSYDTGAVSSAGARGIGQFMPGTGKAYAERLGVTYEQMVNDADLSMQAAAMHMRDLTDQFGSQERALSAYFSGPGGGVHPDYVSAVRGRLPQVAGIEPAGSMPAGVSASKPLYVLPVPGMGPAQLHWGSDPRGTDIMAPEGTPIQSIGAGTVMSVGTTGPGGNSVLIQGADGKQYYYAHLKDPPNVVAGQVVDPGTSLGAVGSTGNAAGGPSHLHLGIGQRILSGTGPSGGVGSEGNAVQFLNDIRDGKYNQGLVQLSQQVDDVGMSFERVNTQAAATTPELSAIGAAIDPVVAGFTKGTVSATGMTDAIIASAAQQGVGTATSEQYAAGLITQDQAMQGVLAGFAATTPAAAELLAQMQAGTITTDQAAVAFAGLATTTATSTGAIVTAAQTMQPAVQASFDLMSEGATVATTMLGTNVLTSITDTAGNMTSTWTEAGGAIITQTATMASGVTISTADMGTQVASTFDEMSGTTQTTVADMAGNSVTTVTDMAGNVVGQTATMATDSIAEAQRMQTDTTSAAQAMQTDVVSAAGEMVSDTASEFQKIDEPANAAKQVMEDVGNVKLRAPDVGSVVGAMKKVEDAAKKALSAVKDITQAEKGGSKSGGGNNPLGKASGGSVSAGTPYMVGETGPELFVPGSDGRIVRNSDLRNGRSGGGTVYRVTVNVNGALLSNDRQIEEAVVRGLNSARNRGREV